MAEEQVLRISAELERLDEILDFVGKSGVAAINAITPITGLSSMVLSGLMETQEEKAYLVTTGYNRNIIRFRRKESGMEI